MVVSKKVNEKYFGQVVSLWAIYTETHDGLLLSHKN